MNLEECLTDTIDEMEPFLKKGQYMVQSYEGVAIIYSDNKLLRNIIINLVSNAIKFSAEGNRVGVRSVFANGNV